MTHSFFPPLAQLHPVRANPFFHLFDDVDFFENRFPSSRPPSRPRYNFEKIATETYCLTLAVTGFDKDDIEINSGKGILSINARHKREANPETKPSMIHNGLEDHDIEVSFNLPPHFHVEGAEIKNGLLLIKLSEDTPEKEKLRKIDIK